MNRRLVFVAAMIGMTAAGAQAQNVISAHSGTLHYAEGVVMIDGTVVEQKAAKFSQIKENGILSTAMGRAEILLTPGVFLRVGEHSSVKLLDNRLASTRIELLSGIAMVESDDPDVSVKNPAVTILYKTYEVQPVKFGLFELDANANELKVFKGQANVNADTVHAVIKEGRKMPFSAALLSERFDVKDADDLYLWTRDRSAYISAANMSAARTISSNSSLYNGFGMLDATTPGSGRWYYNSFLGSFTYMPYGGMFMNPFGYGFYSPYTIGMYYMPSRYYWNGGGTSRTGSATGVALTNIGTSSVASQISRMGSGVNTHATLGSPLRATTGTANAPSYRSGLSNPTSNGPSFNNTNANSSYSPTVASAPVSNNVSAGAAGRFGGGGGGGAVVAAPAAGGGTRGK